MAEKKKFSVKIVEEIRRMADDKKPLSIDVISWNDGKPKLNIRHMYKDSNTDEFKFGKGITLTDEEVLFVFGALETYIEKHEL